MDFKEDVKKHLLELADLNYLEFEQSLNMKSSTQIGIRIPKLREYAKKLSKEYKLEFLMDNIDEYYYEELMLKGFIIGEYKNIDYGQFEKYVEMFVPKINDWGVCDTFCASLKITKKYNKEVWKIISKYLKSKKEFEVRFALVMILDYYINDEYIEKIFDIINNVKLDKYYVKMANAWLISFCIIKQYDKTFKFLKNECKIDNWTYNKAIQKSIESYRVTDEHKKELRKIKKERKD